MQKHDLSKILNLWVELTGVDPCARSFRLGDLDVRRMHEGVREALELDPSQITAYLLLESYASRYFADRCFSIKELLEKPEKTSDYLKKSEHLLTMLRDPEIMDIGKAFALAMRKATRRYQADTPEVLKRIEDRHALALLRRDALRSLENLKIDQFLDGTPENEGSQPQYNPRVFQFWNINSLLAAACKMPSGVSLCLIRDPDAYQSFFAFAIRNGGCLYVLSDVPQHAHPLASQFHHRGDRDLCRRAESNYFPYHLLGIKYDEEIDRIYIEQKDDENGLVPYQQETFPLKAIKELNPDEIIWVTMMFDLIVERFWRKGYKAPELSYTGEMIRVQTPLIDAARQANLPVAAYQPLSVNPLTVEDVRIDNIDPEVLGKDGGQPNRWMEDRYAPQLDDKAINLLGTDQQHYLLTDSSEIRQGDYKDMVPSWKREKHYALASVNATGFGTKKELLANRTFVARHNLAQQIQQQANLEYEERKEKVTKWFTRKVKANLEQLLAMAAKGDEHWVDIDPDNEDTHLGGDHLPILSKCDRGQGITGYRLMRVRPEWDLGNQQWSYENYGGTKCVRLSGGYDSKRGYLCYFNKTSASYRVLFFPQTAADLALLAGCDVAKLPDVLRHWKARSDYLGNKKLDRIDPMAWALKNPWEQLNLNVAIHLSTRAMNRIRKQSPPAKPEVKTADQNPDPDAEDAGRSPR